MAARLFAARHIGYVFSENDGVRVRVNLSDGFLYSNYDLDSKGAVNISKHSYFQGSFGRNLRDELEKSGGKNVELHSYYLRKGICEFENVGAIYKSNNREADNELSSGKKCKFYEGVKRKRYFTTEGSILALQRNSGHFFHFITEVLPSLIHWDAVLPNGMPFVLDAPNYVLMLTKMAGIHRPIVSVPSSALVSFKNVMAVKLLPAGYLQTKSLDLLRNRIRQSCLGSKTEGPKQVLLLRSKGESRKIINEDDLIRAIKAYFPKLAVIFPGQMSMEDQIKNLSSAKIVFGQHGAQLSNLIWSEKLEAVFEFDSPKENEMTKNEYQTLAKSVGAKHYTVKSIQSIPGDHYSDLTVGIDELISMIDNLLFDK